MGYLFFAASWEAIRGSRSVMMTIVLIVLSAGLYCRIEQDHRDSLRHGRTDSDGFGHDDKAEIICSFLRSDPFL